MAALSDVSSDCRCGCVGVAVLSDTFSSAWLLGGGISKRLRGLSLLAGSPLMVEQDHSRVHCSFLAKGERKRIQPSMLLRVESLRNWH